MSFDTNSIHGPTNLALSEAFETCAVNPDVEHVAPPITNMDITQKSVNDGIYAEPTALEAIESVGEGLQVQQPVGSSILGDCVSAINNLTHECQETVGGFKQAPQEITYAINGGQQMDVTEVAQTWTPNLTPSSPFA